MIGETRTYTIELEVTVKYISRGYEPDDDDPGSPNEYEVTEIQLGNVTVPGCAMSYLQKAEQAVRLHDAITIEAEDMADKDGDWDVRDPDYLRDAAE